jgi:hypothetical protein
MGGVIPRFIMNTMFVRKIVQLMLREAKSTYQRLVVSSLSFINLPDFPPYRWTNSNITDKYRYAVPGADPGFQVRGGALKKIAPSGGRREHFWGISCEKSRFYAKKSYFFQLRREARKLLGFFVWQTIIFFLTLGGRAPPWIRPWMTRDGIDKYISVQSWLLFPFYVFQWSCVLFNI